MLSRLGRKKLPFFSRRSIRHETAAWFSTSPNIAKEQSKTNTGSIVSFPIPDLKSHIPAQRSLTIGILRETYDDWERRTPLCPIHVQQLLQRSGYRTTKVLVQPSSQRCFADGDYKRVGAILQEDLSHADVIVGVKRPADSSTLISNKTYMFFSHVIKGQESNMELLKSILQKHVQLVDYECIVETDPVETDEKKRTQRLVAFGRYAGLAGMIDTLYPLGRRLVSDCGVHTPFLQCPLASMQRDLSRAKQVVSEIGQQIAHDGLPLKDPLVFCLTGNGGRVFGGAMEIMNLLPHETMQVQDLPELYAQSNPDPYKVFTVTPRPDELYQRRNCDGPFSVEDWRNHPTEYESKFATEVAPYIHALVNCIYWDPRYARLLTKDDAQKLYESENRRLMVVSDISCDINGSIEFLDRTCTIDKPFFTYNPLTRHEVCADISSDGITVMGTDILPAELPRESSDHFGTAVVQVLSELVDFQTLRNDEEASSTHVTIDLQNATPLLANACITTLDGKLAPRFSYLDSFLQMAPCTLKESGQSIDVLLVGHLFDSGLINTILDTAEHLECRFRIANCRVNRGGDPKDVVPTQKSTAVVQFTSENQTNLNKLEAKIEALIDIMDKAEATMNVVKRTAPKQTDVSGGVEGCDQESRRDVAVVENQEEQKVLVLGAGRVSMSLVEYLGRTPQKYIQVASDNESEASHVAKLAQRGAHTCLDLSNTKDLSSLVKDHDVVISLLPAPLHPTVAEECIKQKTHLVTASYESPEIRAMDQRAKNAGVIILNEVGLDPGLDHMSAMKIINDVHARGGTVVSFKSVCGGLPAPEAADNPLKYKFSWSPRGVILASQNAARYRWNNEVIDIPGTKLMQSATPFTDSWPEMILECLPNRDSLKYECIYGIDETQTLFRGTLRYEGFCSLMSVFQRMGLFESSKSFGPTWQVALDAMRKKQGNFASIDDFLLHCADGDQNQATAAKEALHWLEIEGAAKVANTDSVVDSLCAVLEEKLQFGETERDMVAMHTSIQATFDDCFSELHQSRMLAFGDSKMSAMCRTVGIPAAAAANLILSGGLKNYAGLVLPTEKSTYLPILAAVEKEGIMFEESVNKWYSNNG